MGIFVRVAEEGQRDQLDVKGICDEACVLMGGLTQESSADPPDELQGPRHFH